MHMVYLECVATTAKPCKSHAQFIVEGNTNLKEVNRIALSFRSLLDAAKIWSEPQVSKSILTPFRVNGSFLMRRELSM